jgi:hypothetical protein
MAYSTLHDPPSAIPSGLRSFQVSAHLAQTFMLFGDLYYGYSTIITEFRSHPVQGPNLTNLTNLTILTNLTPIKRLLAEST